MYKGEYQHDERDCGAACIATVCRYYGLKIPIVKIRVMEMGDMNGISVYEIEKIAERLGLEATGMKGSWEELIETVNNQEIRPPFIARLILPSELNHYVVVWEINKIYIKIFDPSKGIIKMKISEFNRVWSGYIVAISKTQDFQMGNLKKGYFKKYFEVAFSHKKLLFSLVVLSLTISFITVGGAFIYQTVVDRFIIHAEMHVIKEAGIFFISLLILYLFRMFIYIIRGFQAADLGKYIENQILGAYFTKLLKIKMKIIQAFKGGEILARYNDIRNIRDILSIIPINIFLDIIMAIFAGLAIFILSPYLFIVALVFIIIYAVMQLIFKTPVYRAYRLIAEKEAETTSLLKESIDGIETIKGYNAESFFSNKLRYKGEVLLESIRKANNLYTINNGVASSIEAIGQLLIFWVGSVMVTENLLTLGTLITILNLLNYLFDPLRSIIEMQNKILTAMISMERLNDILESVEENQEEESAENSISFSQDIQFQDVTFSYGKWVMS